jgi:hypothetical protein
MLAPPLLLLGLLFGLLLGLGLAEVGAAFSQACESHQAPAPDVHHG